MLPDHVTAAAWDVIGQDLANVQGGLDLVGAYHASVLADALGVAASVVALLEGVDHPAVADAVLILGEAVARAQGGI